MRDLTMPTTRGPDASNGPTRACLFFFLWGVSTDETRHIARPTVPKSPSPLPPCIGGGAVARGSVGDGKKGGGIRALGCGGEGAKSRHGRGGNYLGVPGGPAVLAAACRGGL